MKTVVRFFCLAVCAVALMAGSASAKDDLLLQDFVSLEKSYIVPLFFTNAQAPAAFPSMATYKKSWTEFSEKYYFYRADHANWQVYFDRIDQAVAAADALVGQARSTGNMSLLPLAHEEMEAARMVMLELRPRNGFPKFITDRMTIYHDPMEHIVLSLKGKTAGEIDDALLAELRTTLDEALKAWDGVTKCPVDPGLWGFPPAKMLAYYDLIARETALLQAFESALASGDPQAIIPAGMALKPTFVQTYKMFGDFSPYMPQ